MKYLLFGLSVLILLSGCTFEYSEGSTTTEETTITTSEEDEPDVKITEKGLSCEKSFMSNPEGEFKMNTTFGENIQMNFVQVEGLEVVDGAIRVDVMFLFTTLSGDTVLFFNYGDIREQDFEVPDEDRIDFNVYTPVSSPVWSGQKYIFKGGFKDVRTGNSIEGETTLKVNPNYNIEIEDGGLSYSEIYLFDATDNVFVVNQLINRTNKNQLRIREIDGFKLVNENALIGASLLLLDDQGEEILTIEDMGADMKNGMPYEQIKDILTVDFSLAEHVKTSYVDLEVRIWDKNSDNSLEVKTRVDVAAQSPM